MKVAAIIEYAQDRETVKAVWPAHRVYLRGFLENGKLLAAGPFEDGSGALWVLEVETLEEADAIVGGDPFVAADAITGWKLRPFAYWSAQPSKGK